MKKPLISVVMPVYNVSQYIERSILSVINQTYQAIELVIVNDGSKDNSVSIAEDLLEQHGFSYRLINQINSGVSSARNKGIKESHGEYVFVMDSDDIIHPKTIDTLHTICLNHKVDYAFSGYKSINQKDENPPINSFDDVLLRKGKDACQKYYRRKEKYIAPALFIKRTAIEEHNLFYDEECKFAEDDLYVWNVLAVAEKIAYFPQPLYGYVYHENSTMTSSTYEKYLTSYHCCKKLKMNVIDKSLNMCEWAELFVPRHMLGVIHAASKVLPFDEVEKLINDTSFYQESKKLLNSKSLSILIVLSMFHLSRPLFYQFLHRF